MSITLAPDYYWGPKLTKPGKLLLSGTSSFYTFDPGVYEVICVPVGDNWAISNPDMCEKTIVTLGSRGSFSVMPRFNKNEPSCGSLICVRKQGEPWRINDAPAGMTFGRLSMPVYAHIGARHGRYVVNGYPWTGEWTGPKINSTYWSGSPVGPKLLWSETRQQIIPSQYGPDVNIVSNIPGRTIYVAVTKVDMFERETAMSDPLEINIDSDYGHFVTVRRNYDTEMGTNGWYVYAGYSPDTMHRQPVLNYEGSTPKYLWPVQMQQFHIHRIIENNIFSVLPPDYGVASILNKPQKQVVDGEKYINFDKNSYELYCPFLLPWDSAKFGRKIGFNGKRAVFNHRSNYGAAKLAAEIPLLYIQNQADEFANATFRSNKAICGVTFSDWSGGQAFSDAITNCRFELSSEDSYGFLVEDTSSIWNGNHTASEIRVKNTTFGATIPVKIEGNQSAKIRFTDMCSFHANGNTRYKSDTVGTIYACCPNQISAKEIEGINGEFRALVCLVSYSGPAIVNLYDFFCDMGCNVYACFSAYNGGTASFEGGERINSHSQQWIRLAEAPSSLYAKTRFRDINVVDRTSSVSFQLNQLALDLDFNVSEIICPDESFWVGKGLMLEYPGPDATTNPAYFDFRKKKNKGYDFGFNNVPDTLPKKIPDQISTVVLKLGTKGSSKLSSHWANPY